MHLETEKITSPSILIYKPSILHTDSILAFGGVFITQWGRKLRPQEVICLELKRGRVIIHTWSSDSIQAPCFPTIWCLMSNNVRWLLGLEQANVSKHGFLSAKWDDWVKWILRSSSTLTFHDSLMVFLNILEWWLNTVFNEMLHALWYWPHSPMSSAQQSKEMVMGSDNRGLQEGLNQNCFSRGLCLPPLNKTKT